MPKAKKIVPQRKKASSPKKPSEAYVSALAAVERMGKTKPKREKLH